MRAVTLQHRTPLVLQRDAAAATVMCAAAAVEMYVIIGLIYDVW
jgi:hypothetical protein